MKNLYAAQLESKADALFFGSDISKKFDVDSVEFNEGKGVFVYLNDSTVSQFVTVDPIKETVILQ